MEMEAFYKLIFCVFVLPIISGKVVKKDACGSLSVSEPAVQKRPITVTFEPVSYGDYGEFVEWGKGNSYFEPLNASSNISMYWSDSKYYLHFDNTTFIDHDVYSAVFNRPLLIPCVVAVQINITELTNCGLLYQRTRRIVAGADVELGYLPPMSVINNPGKHVRHWLFTPDVCPGPEVCTSRNITGDYPETEIKSNMEYVLTIPNINSTMNGVYKLHCTKNEGTNKETNGIRIHMLVPPMFMDTRDFNGCKQCVYGTQDHTTTIRCKTMDDTQPVVVDIFVNQTILPTIFSGGVYSATLQTTARDMHLCDVLCVEYNKALEAPLHSSTKLYVISKPENPKLRVNKLNGSQPISVSCSSFGGRPAPNVTFYISERLVTSSRITTTYIHDTLTTKALLSNMDRMLNWKTVMCCLSHEMLEKDTCSLKKLLYYYFPPSMVVIKPPHIITGDGSFFIMNVICVIKEASSSCPADWYFRNTTVTNILENTTYGNAGFTTTNVAVLNITEVDDGETIKCKARCEKVNVGKTEEYTITFPEHQDNKTVHAADIWPSFPFFWPMIAATAAVVVVIASGIAIKQVVKKSRNNELEMEMQAQANHNTR